MMWSWTVRIGGCSSRAQRAPWPLPRPGWRWRCTSCGRTFPLRRTRCGSSPAWRGWTRRRFCLWRCYCSFPGWCAWSFALGRTARDARRYWDGRWWCWWPPRRWAGLWTSGRPDRQLRRDVRVKRREPSRAVPGVRLGRPAADGAGGDPATRWTAGVGGAGAARRRDAHSFDLEPGPAVAGVGLDRVRGVARMAGVTTRSACGRLTSPRSVMRRSTTQPNSRHLWTLRSQTTCTRAGEHSVQAVIPRNE